MTTIAKNMAILVDTSILLAASFTRDANHMTARHLLRTLQDQDRLVPVTVLSELFYLAATRISYVRAIQIFARTRAAFEIQALVEPDMVRMQAIMEQYNESRFDFVDVSIMSLAERLRIPRICTLDRRDFSIFRPSNYDHFELLP